MNFPFWQRQALPASRRRAQHACGRLAIRGVVVLQSGAFLTPDQDHHRPWWDQPALHEVLTRADKVSGVPAYVHGTPSTAGDPTFLNINAFADPANNSASFGNAGVGNVVGPGTRKLLHVADQIDPAMGRSQVSIWRQTANVFNHRNYETPDMNVDDGPTGFGIITGSADRRRRRTPKHRDHWHASASSLVCAHARGRDGQPKKLDHSLIETHDILIA